MDEVMDTCLELAVAILLIDDEPRPLVCPSYMKYGGNAKNAL
jgi:hypothetical protein